MENRLIPIAMLAGALALAGCGGGSGTPADTTDTDTDTEETVVVEPTPVQRAINAAEAAVAGLDEDSTRAEVVAAGERIQEARDEISDLAAADRADPRVTVNGIEARLDLTARLDVIDKIATAVTLSTAETVNISATEAAIEAAEEAITGLADATLGTAYAVQLSDPMTALATAKGDAASIKLANDQKAQREAIAEAVKEARAAVAAVNAALDAISDTTDSSTVTEAKAKIAAVGAAIASATTGDDGVLTTTDMSVMNANTALVDIQTALDLAEKRLTTAIAERKKQIDDRTRVANNAAAKAVEDAINRHKVTGGSALPDSLLASSLKATRANKQTSIALRTTSGEAVPSTPVSWSEGGWNGRSFTLDGEKGAVFSNIGDAQARYYDVFFGVGGSSEAPNVTSNTDGVLTITANARPAKHFGTGADRLTTIPANSSRRGTFYGVVGNYSCTAECTFTLNAAGTMITPGSSVTFTPDAIRAGTALATLRVPDASVADAQHLHFGYWMTSDKRRDGSYRHDIETFAGATGYSPFTTARSAAPTVPSAVTAPNTATYEGAAGGYYTHEDSRDGALERTHGEFSAEASLTAKFAAGGDISVNDATSVSGTISDFVGEPGTNLSGWKLMLNRTQWDSGSGVLPTGTTSDSAVPGAEAGNWHGTLFSSGTTSDQLGAIVGEFNGNFENGHVAGAFGAEHAD